MPPTTTIRRRCCRRPRGRMSAPAPRPRPLPAASCWWYSTILSSLVDLLVPFASQSFLQNDRPAQMGRLLGIEPARVREAYGGAVDADEVDHGILPGLDDGSARLPARREHRGIEVAERPHRRLGAARADRTV